MERKELETQAKSAANWIYGVGRSYFKKEINPMGFSGLAILAWRNDYFKDTTSKELNDFVKKYWEFRKSLLPKNITEAYSVSRCGVGWN